MANEHRDPWARLQTAHGLQADEVISALQKEIRRGHVENAALLAYEMAVTSPTLEAYLWQRLTVISVEDIGLAEPTAVVVVRALAQAAMAFGPEVGERKLFAVHAVRYLCGRRKDRASDEFLTWIAHGVKAGTLRPEIPDYALDVHTERGRAMGRGARHFWTEGTRLHPEWEGREGTWRSRLSDLLDRNALGGG